MPKRDRAARRRQNVLKKIRAARILSLPYQFDTGGDWRTALELASRRADHLASCSCFRCANPRKVSGDLTRQERRSLLDD